MKTLNSIQHHFRFATSTRIVLPQVVAVLGLAVIPIALVAIVSLWKDIPVRYLLKDPVAILEKPFYFGFLSQLGIFIWAAMIAICFLTARVLLLNASHYSLRRFFTYSGLFVLMLGLDDVFLLHEEVFSRLLGIPEVLVYASYASLAIAYLWTFRKIILRSGYTLLAVAWVGFGLSIGLDVLNPPYINPYFFEDSFKFIGLVAWLVL